MLLSVVIWGSGRTFGRWSCSEDTWVIGDIVSNGALVFETLGEIVMSLGT